MKRTLLVSSIVLWMAAAGLFAAHTPAAQAAATPTLVISQVPLTTSTPLHSQVLFAVGNSQSMDGDLSGAIMTGSGALGSDLTSLSASSSPAYYSIPGGFTPPINTGFGGYAPYTVTNNKTLYDNSASRLNVAKAGIQAIINSYMVNTDFALETYDISNSGLYSTWVYYMSASGGFTFTNTLPDTPPASGEYVLNPCYHYTTVASSTVSSNCSSIASSGLSGISSATLAGNKYMYVAASSDDPSINDVLYAGSLSGLCIAYSGPSPATPYPPDFSLADYEAGNILISYKKKTSSCATATGPTNAGYAPYSPQVMYAQRGFGYYADQKANDGSVLVPMTSAGKSPTAASLQTAINAFSDSLAPETSSNKTAEIKANAVQSPLAGLMKYAKTYLAKSATNSDGCSLQQYVVLITDGLPTEDLGGHFWPPLGSLSAAGYGVTATFQADGSLDATNDQALTDAIAAIAALKEGGVKTYVVGLGAGVDSTLNPSAAATLKAMAVAGGTGSFFPATSPSALVADLTAILQQVQAGSASASSVAVNSSSLRSGTLTFQAAYTAQDSPYLDWTGSLKAFPVNAATGAVDTAAGAEQWNAQTLLDTAAAGLGWSGARLIATWNASSAKGVPFQWASLSAAQQALLQPGDSYGIFRLDYLRGESAHEKRNGGYFRNRSHLLGDIVDSNPLYVGAPGGAYDDSTYLAFAKAQAGRAPRLYVGANDGMLHAFDPGTGQEKFAYVPNGVFSHLIDLVDPLYNTNHRFFVDGSPQAGDVMFASDGSWHTVLVGGEGAGGATIYALDVTNPQNLTTEAAVAGAALWEFSDADMGLSFSPPVIARINASAVAHGSSPGFAVFFGNGYNSASQHAILYAVNPETGAPIKKIDLCNAVAGACSASAANGLSGVALANLHGYLGQPVDMAYAGDLQGNLWAIDVSDADPTNWKVWVLYKAEDSSGKDQPITVTPVLTLHPQYPNTQGLLVLFGTGQLLTSSDLSATQTQSFYGIWDDNFAAATKTTVTQSELTQQVLTDATLTNGTVIRTESENTLDWSTQKGWYFDLPAAGERVVTQPAVSNGSVIFTTDVFSTSACTLDLSSWLMDMNYATGGVAPNLKLNVLLGNASAVGLSMGKVFSSGPTIISGSSGQSMVYVGDSKLKINNYDTTGAAAKRNGWWQLQ